MVLSNVVLDLLFILAFEWGIAGCRLATGLSYLIGLSVYLPALLRKNSPVNLLIGRFKMKLVGKLLTIGSAEGVTEPVRLRRDAHVQPHHDALRR